MQAPLSERIAIIGLGLIGSSIARAVREKGVARLIFTCDSNELSLAYARKHAFADVATTDPVEAVQKADIVILATPPDTLEDIARAIAPHLAAGTLVMDVGSVKLSAVAAISPHMPPQAHYIPAHPIAGSEQSGVAAGRSSLFEHRRVVLSPELPKLTPALEKAMLFWQALGSTVEPMPAHLHDLIYAYVSHLPQLLAFAAAHPLEKYLDNPEGELLQKFLRLSHSSTDMWVEIFLQNRTNVLTALDRYMDALLHVSGELQPPDEPVKESDGIAARTRLFPRIAAACLVTTVMEAEKKAGFPFARYAGTGFADFTFPASQPPEEDIEHISNQHIAVRQCLLEYADRLRHFREAIASGNSDNAAVALGETG